MVPFGAKCKWLLGWRRLRHMGRYSGYTAEDDKFSSYWIIIHARLKEAPPIPRPLPSPSSSASSSFYADLGDPKWVLAPMVIQSERAFRILVKQHGVDMTFSPMMIAEDVVQAGPGFAIQTYAKEFLTACPQERPIAAQIAGSDPIIMVEATRLLASTGNVDVIDVNFGCPQKCASFGGYGIFLATEKTELAITVVKALVEGCRLPVSCKLRLFPSLEASIQFARSLEAVGCSMLTIHGRRPDLRDHQGPSDLDTIRAIREAVNIPVLANGNVRTKADAEAILRYTGCHGVMSAIGLLRNPRLFDVDDDDDDPLTSSSGYELSLSGTLVDPCQALVIALEYIDHAEKYPVPEVRCIRDHLQTICQGFLQYEHIELWALLGNDRMVSIEQFRQLLRLTAQACGVLEEVDRRVGTPVDRREVMRLQDIKLMNRTWGFDDDDGEGMEGGLGCSGWALFGDEDEEEEEWDDGNGGEQNVPRLTE